MYDTIEVAGACINLGTLYKLYKCVLERDLAANLIKYSSFFNLLNIFSRGVHALIVLKGWSKF